MTGVVAQTGPVEPLDDTEPDPGPRRRSPGFVLAVALAVVFGALAVLLGVLLATSGDDAAEDERREIARLAGQFGEDFLTFDYDDLDEHRERVTSYTTESYAREYEKALDLGLETILTETRSRWDGSVADVFLSDVDEGSAAAIVAASIRQEGTAGPRRVDDVYFEVELLSVEGEWRVDNVISLNFSLAGSSAPLPGAAETTTTTAAAG
jgi:hypothetical protein